MSNQRYPLDWPQGYARSEYRPGRPLFKAVTLSRAVYMIEEEVRKLTGSSRDVVISSNGPLKNDGYPRADYMRSTIIDPGVAVYFKHGDDDVVLCCDKWIKIEDNLKAIAVTIEDMRRIERNGVSDFIKRSFTGFKQLPAGPTWWSLLLWTAEPDPTPSNWSVTQGAYRTQAATHHPDRGGDAHKMAEINYAYEEAKKYFKNAI